MKRSSIEKEIHREGFERIAGVDEAGRGPLAGPVVAAACVLPHSFSLPDLDDSKKLSSEKRKKLYQELTGNPEIDWGVGLVEAPEVDELNIHVASLEAMRRAVERLKTPPDFLLIDGCHTFASRTPIESVVGGDGKILAIAAASIIAKVTRDRIMMGYDALYPAYAFERHKGYGTEVHRKAVQEEGPTPIHRKTFKGGT